MNATASQPSNERLFDAEALPQLSDAHKKRLLSVSAGDDVGVQKSDWRLLLRIFPMLRDARFALALVMVPLSIYATLQQPMAIKRAVDGVVSNNHADWRVGLLIYGVAVVVQFVSTFVESYCIQVAGQHAMATLRTKVFDHAQRLRIGYYDRTAVGRVLTRITNDVDALGELFASGAIMAVADVFMLLGVVAFMLRLDWRLSLVAFAALPPLAWMVEWIRRRARMAARDIRLRVSQLNSYLSEQVQGMQVVQAFGREATSAAEYGLINDAYRRANHRAIRYDAMLYSIVEGVSSVCIAAMLYYGSVRAGLLEDSAQTALYLGTVAAFYQYIQQFFVPIRDLSTKYTLVQSALAAAERVFSFLDLHETVPVDPAQPPPVQLDHDPLIRFNDVHFGYRDEEEVLHGVSFDVKRGEHVAIVGATGAGKTSTVALLQRLYEVTGGSIEFGGADIRAVGVNELRQRLAVVPQDVFLFSGTVAQNVAMSATFDRKRVEEALTRVSAMELFAARGGIDAKIGERGANLSAGERQLLAFARALYRDAEVLILDEATANIDSNTEAKIQAAIDELMRGRTAIVIAHRLSTVRRANRILVFHRGQLAEQGTHQELLENGRIYAHLHHLQFAAE